MGLEKQLLLNFFIKKPLWLGKDRSVNMAQNVQFSKEEVIDFLERKGFPKKFAQKVLHFAEVNEEVKG